MRIRPEPEPVDARVVDDPDVLPDDAEEAVDGEPVLEAGALGPVSPSPTALAVVASPAVQAAAAAATGFVAGAATLAIVRRRDARRGSRPASRRRGADALPILASRSFLIDIHMLRDE